MNDPINISGTKLGAKEKDAVITFCEALRDLQQTNLVSVSLYGSATHDDFRSGKSDINLLIVLNHIDVKVLKNVLTAVNQARRYGISPFFITEENIHSSADVFPVKFLSMKESFQLLLGRDILGEVNISNEHLRLRCEQGIKNLLLRLRRHYIMSNGRRLAGMMSNMFIGFLENIRIILSLKDNSMPQRKDIIDNASRSLEIDPAILQNIRSLRHGNLRLSVQEEEQLFDDFMGIVEKVAKMTDELK